MARPVSVGVIGDFNPEFPPHSATKAALEHAAAALGVQVDVRWLGTTELEDVDLAELANHDALWCAPGSPYRSLNGALRAIRFARESDWPFIGTCGGFQHAVIEYARNVLGFRDAQHAEYDPYASDLFISALSCSLVGHTMSVRLCPGSRALDFYGQSEVSEQYYCNFGLNPEHQESLHQGGLRVAGTDQDGEARVLELPDKRFYLATLFVPQLSSQTGSPHPLITAYLRAALDLNPRAGAQPSGASERSAGYRPVRTL
jgi:CTP synthase (UTP-ammonia lyase)